MTPPASARAASAGIAAQDAVVRYWTPARMAAAAVVTTTLPASSGAGGGGPISTAYPGVTAAFPAQARPTAKAGAKPRAGAKAKAGATAKAGAKAKARPTAKAGAKAKARAKAAVKAKSQPAPKAPVKAKVRTKAKAQVTAKLRPKATPQPKTKAGQKVPAKAAARPQWLSGDTAGHGLRWTHGGAVADAVGKVYFTLGGVAYACTGALVSSAKVDIVLTAAHCVSGGLMPGGRTEWAANWLFVPGYRGGRLPYGEYTARRFFISSRWTGPAVSQEADDVAFVQVGPVLRQSGAPVPVPPPGLRVKFAAQSTVQTTAQSTGQSLTRAYVFGFPQEPPYSGLYPDFCAGPVLASGASVRTDCGMTAGDSGGPWFGQFSPRTGTGTITAVSTYKLSGNMAVLYGAVLGPLARALYQRAGSWR